MSTLLEKLASRIYAFLLDRVIFEREPDFIIGGADNPYLKRWWLIPRNRFFNVYLHVFFRSDDDRALHDHPWSNLSFILAGGYTEHTIDAGGIHNQTRREQGDLKLRISGKHAHRIELDRYGCITLFITGPRYREWGFHCTDRGWVHWKDFVAKDDQGAVGPGCGE